MRRWPWCALGLTIVAGLLSSESFGPERFSLLRGLWSLEPYRLWTGHFVHFNAAHLRGDVLAFMVWAALIEWRSRRLLLALVGLGAPLLSILVLGLHPSLHEYRGLSALDCALAIALMLLHRHEQRALSIAALTLLIAKFSYECLTGHAVLAPQLGEGVRLLPLSHLLGALLGAVFVWGPASVRQGTQIPTEAT